MKKALLILFVIVSMEALAQAPKSAQKPMPPASVQKPKLVVAIIVDQFRYDYLLRFDNEYKGGIRRLLNKGAVFVNARYNHYPTVTAVGHAVFLTGAFPGVNGIVGNGWFDRESKKNIAPVSDESEQQLGGKGQPGSSPKKLLVSTVGDEMKMSGQGSKVFGISLKDYSGILMSGRAADGVFWFDSRTGSFTSSTYYFSDLPAWVKEFNDKRPADRFKAAEWLDKTMIAEPGPKLYGSLLSSPFGNELMEEFAECAIKNERLGRNAGADLLALSFSSNDFVGHASGPDSPEVREISKRTDRLLEKLFKYIDAEVGMANTMVVFAADHGVAPMPEVNAKRKMPGGRTSFSVIREAVQKELSRRFGEGKWIISPADDGAIYLNVDLIDEKKLKRSEVESVAEETALAAPHVFRTYTRERLKAGYAMQDQLGGRVLNSFHMQRGADLIVLLDPYWFFGAPPSTTHGSPFGYDTHVPVIFMGPGIKSGKYYDSIAVNDVAPTLATILGVEIPSGASGRILSEIFASR
jgi:predicted AlkP superfamily pyrophosphatase or phosphodiesterase